MLSKIIVAIIGAIAAGVAGYVFGHGNFTINGPLITTAPPAPAEVRVTVHGQPPTVAVPAATQIPRDPRCNPCAPGFVSTPRSDKPCWCATSVR
jgi:hypothetical protein